MLWPCQYFHLIRSTLRIVLNSEENRFLSEAGKLIPIIEYPQSHTTYCPFMRITLEHLLGANK